MNALEASTAAIVSPSLLLWLAVAVPTTGAWFLASMVKVWAVLPPRPSDAVSVTV